MARPNKSDNHENDTSIQVIAHEGVSVPRSRSTEFVANGHIIYRYLINPEPIAICHTTLGTKTCATPPQSPREGYFPPTISAGTRSPE